MGKTPGERIISLAEQHGVITAADAARRGIHSQQLTRLVQQRILDRVARGHYRLAARPVTEQHGLVVAAMVAPHGVICLLSALAFHGIGTQLPADIWVAIERRARKPAARGVPLRIVRFGGSAFTEGVERHTLEGTIVRVYSVAKTLADLFKYRNTVGLDVALEALRDAWNRRLFTMDALDHAARVCRVERVMKPYLEALVA